MVRLSNRLISDQKHQAPQVHYVNNVVETPAQTIVQTVETRVEVPVDRIVEVEKVIHTEAPAVNLEPIYDKLLDLEGRLQIIAHTKNQFIKQAIDELQMQHMALVALKTQRDIDRKRRLQFIIRLKKQRDEQRSLNLKLKLVVAASLVLSVLTLVLHLR